MKIKINIKNFSIPIFLPNRLLKSNFFISKLGDNIDKQSIKNLYPILKKYIKENGHFILLDIKDSSENVNIKITV